MKTLIERLLEAGYRKDEVFHWMSDLYVFVTPMTTKVINEWLKDEGLAKDLFVSVFKDQVTGKPMYECAFQYYEVK